MQKELKQTEANFLPISMDSLCLRVAQLPGSQDVAIFMLTTNKTNSRLYPLHKLASCGFLENITEILHSLQAVQGATIKTGPL